MLREHIYLEADLLRLPFRNLNSSLAPLSELKKGKRGVGGQGRSEGGRDPLRLKSLSFVKW